MDERKPMTLAFAIDSLEEALRKIEDVAVSDLATSWWAHELDPRALLALRRTIHRAKTHRRRLRDSVAAEMKVDGLGLGGS